MPPEPGARPGLAALVIAAAVAAVASIGALFQPGPWYADLAKPPGTPPDIVFPIVWTLLYVAMVVAAALIYRAAGTGRSLGWFGVQLVLNAAWSPVVFGGHWLAPGLVVIVTLWFALIATIRGFHRVRPVAALLLAPYLVWVGYAAYLNAGLLVLN